MTTMNDTILIPTPTNRNVDGFSNFNDICMAATNIGVKGYKNIIIDIIYLPDRKTIDSI
jgi:hypothetical protein